MFKVDTIMLLFKVTEFVEALLFTVIELNVVAPVIAASVPPVN